MSARVRRIALPVTSVAGVTLAVIGLLLPVAELRTQHSISDLLPPDTSATPISLRDALFWLGYGAPRGVSRGIYVVANLAWYAAALGGALLIPVLGQRLRFWTALTRWSYLIWIALTESGQKAPALKQGMNGSGA
jgi:hypothetical protein